MTQLRVRCAKDVRAERSARSLALLTLAVVASACDRSTPVATTDSLLQRDLTLAASEYAPASATASVGDTAIASAGRIEPNRTATPSPRTPPRAAPPVSAPRARPTVRTDAPVAAATAAAPQAAPVPAAVSPSAAPVQVPKTDEGTSAATSGSTHAGAAKTIGRGVSLTGRTNAAICSPANRPGDRLVANLATEVVSPDGARLPAGTPILVELAAPATDGEFVFRVKAVMVNGVLIPVEGLVAVDGETTKRRVSNGGNGTKVAGGAIVGAIIGGIFGGGKGAAIGAVGGATAGTIAAQGNSVTETCLPSGATLTVTLSAPLVLSQGTP